MNAAKGPREGREISTGLARDRENRVSRAAVNACGTTAPIHKPKEKTFEEWAKSWRKFDTCPHIHKKIANNVTRAYLDSRRTYLDKHPVPEFG
jgi:hypothetical protein